MSHVVGQRPVLTAGPASVQLVQPAIKARVHGHAPQGTAQYSMADGTHMHMAWVAMGRGALALIYLTWLAASSGKSKAGCCAVCHCGLAYAPHTNDHIWYVHCAWAGVCTHTHTVDVDAL